MDNDAIVVSPETSEAGRMYGESIRLSLAGEAERIPHPAWWAKVV